ncbi:hypothetical protein [Sphingomonas glaciei]|uniref:ABC transporter ATP-binding protein n=1 Tax=Sphingomonas glaciei TaxID=2938948 RepID=A0ABY5MW92_9SPHN|nr:hypothetical protein [Sphingomonas glaciei]UUR08249.1 hypothetical protein M1K48_00960 [Sphingomonas glaciei]
MSTDGHPGDGWPRAIPQGGVKGGEIVAVGTPEQVVQEPRSYTGHYLRPLLERADGSTQGLGNAAETAAPRLGVALAEARLSVGGGRRWLR